MANNIEEPTTNLDQEVPEVKTIEVERKFVIGDDSEQKLQELGAELNCEQTFTDVYYDTDDYILTLADHWLRQRDGKWQLKYPPENREKDDRTSQYVEVENEGDIVKVLCNILDILSVDGQSALKDLLRVSNCNEFAKFSTHRKSYAFDGFRVDLDTADFGFKVGEIELLVLEENRISEALGRIDDLANKLDLRLLGAADLPVPLPQELAAIS